METQTKTEETFKDRLIKEKTELNEKIKKLQSFQETEAFQKIEPIQMSLLNIQLQAMRTYSQCLVERITWIESSAIAN